ncbi:hypothetical protein [Leifsonella bigeumensis]
MSRTSLWEATVARGARDALRRGGITDGSRRDARYLTGETPVSAGDA